MLARLLVLTIHTGWADSPIVQMVLFAIALRHGDITIQHTGRNSTQADTAHRQIQHTGRYSTQADTAHRQIQHTGRYSTQADIAHRQI